MKNIAEALVFVVTFIDIRPDPEEEHLDDDVDALESIASMLDEATEDEMNALAVAAESLLAAERSLPQPREQWVRGYSNWMEEMFGDPWKGNRRV